MNKKDKIFPEYYEQIEIYLQKKEKFMISLRSQKKSQQISQKRKQIQMIKLDPLPLDAFNQIDQNSQQAYTNFFQLKLPITQNLMIIQKLVNSYYKVEIPQMIEILKQNDFFYIFNRYLKKSNQMIEDNLKIDDNWFQDLDLLFKIIYECAKFVKESNSLDIYEEISQQLIEYQMQSMELSCTILQNKEKNHLHFVTSIIFNSYMICNQLNNGFQNISYKIYCLAWNNLKNFLSLLINLDAGNDIELLDQIMIFFAEFNLEITFEYVNTEDSSQIINSIQKILEITLNSDSSLQNQSLKKNIQKNCLTLLLKLIEVFNVKDRNFIKKIHQYEEICQHGDLNQNLIPTLFKILNNQKNQINFENHLISLNIVIEILQQNRDSNLFQYIMMNIDPSLPFLQQHLFQNPLECIIFINQILLNQESFLEAKEQIFSNEIFHLIEQILQNSNFLQKNDEQLKSQIFSLVYISINAIDFQSLEQQDFSKWIDSLFFIEMHHKRNFQLDQNIGIKQPLIKFLILQCLGMINDDQEDIFQTLEERIFAFTVLLLITQKVMKSDKAYRYLKTKIYKVVEECCNGEDVHNFGEIVINRINDLERKFEQNSSKSLKKQQKNEQFLILWKEISNQYMENTDELL